MGIIFIYTIPALVSFVLMNECYKRNYLDNSGLAAVCCLIPFLNWLCIIIFSLMLYDRRK